jgi:hypothetical protein
MSLDDAGGLVPHFWCIATDDRDVLKTVARQLANAQQQLAAQCRILTGQPQSGGGVGGTPGGGSSLGIDELLEREAVHE